ncbi:unnamed protein product [Brassica oleracea]
MLLVGLDPFMGLRCLLPKATKKSWHSKILSLPDDYELGSLILLPSILLVYDLSSRLSLQGSPSQSRDDVLSFDPRFLQPSQVSRDLIVSALLLMSTTVKFKQMRHFSTAITYCSGITHIFLPAINFHLRQRSFGNSVRAHPPLLLDT